MEPLQISGIGNCQSGAPSHLARGDAQQSFGAKSNRRRNLLRKRRSMLLLLIPVMLLTQAFACNKYHTAVAIEHDFTIAVKAFQDGETALFQAGNISPAEHQLIESKIAQVAVVGQALNNLITANATQQSVSAEVKLLTAAITDLNNNGVFQVKNPQAQAQLKVALQAISDIVQNLTAALGA
jgi:hypothetical protein